MTERSAADEEILRLATADDEPGEKQPAAEKPKDETLELGGEDAPKATDADLDEDEEKKNRSRHPSQRIAHYRALAGEAERRAAEAERRAEEAERKAGIAKPTTPTLDEIMAKEPKPEDFEFGAADPDYLDARQDWKLDVRDAKARGDTEKSRAEKAVAEAQQKNVEELSGMLASKVDAGKSAYDDFDEVVNKAAAAREEPMHPVVTVAAASSPVGEHIIYRLASDESVQERLDGEIAKAMQQVERLRASGQQPSPSVFAGAARAFGELEGQYLETDDDDDLDLSDPLDLARQVGRERARRKGLNAKPATVKTTKAPAPPERQARGTSGQFEISEDGECTHENGRFAALERQIMGKKG